MALSRVFTLLLGIADELGRDGCRASGFYHILGKLTTKLADCIADNKIRSRIYRANHELINKGDDHVLSFLLASHQEMQRVIRSKKRS